MARDFYINSRNQNYYWRHLSWKEGDEIKRGNCFDVIFVNSKGEITEGARSNLFIEKEGTFFTPPVSCGLFPGILRQNMILKNSCREKILYKDDLLGADAVYCGNSVRGLVKVSF